MIGNSKHKGSPYYIEFCRKIILTTDQDLIKDGVQPIDDEFLEFIVKNPSCESIEVESGLFFYAEGEDRRYKITIPKEEPKQETLEEVALRLYPDKGYEDEVYCDIGEYNRELFIEGAKWQAEQDNETLYSYDEVRAIAYKAYCIGQLDEPTEGKFNQWINQFKKA
jgi:hypothetical protein